MAELKDPVQKLYDELYLRAAMENQKANQRGAGDKFAPPSQQELWALDAARSRIGQPGDALRFHQVGQQRYPNAGSISNALGKVYCEILRVMADRPSGEAWNAAVEVAQKP